MRASLLAGTLVVLSQQLLAQAPAIGRNGVRNAASQIPLSLVNGEVARGSLVSITGVRLAVPVRLNNLPVTVVSATPSELQVRLPANAPLESAGLTLSQGTSTSAPFAVRIVASQFGIFSRNGKGYGPGRIDNRAANGARVSNSMEGAAIPGQSVVIAGTGLGDAKTPLVTVGGRQATVMSLRKADSASGADEITARLPGDAPEGCFVTVQVSRAGRLPSNVVTMSISRSGGACRLPESIPVANWAGSRLGLVVVARGLSEGAEGVHDTTDEAGATFLRLPEVSQMPLLFLPPAPGTCTSRVDTVDTSLPAGNPFVTLLVGSGAEAGLSAGPSLNIDDGKIQRRIQGVEGVPGIYHTRFAAMGMRGGAGELPNFLGPAQLHVSASGGNVGRFDVMVGGPQPFGLRSVPAAIDRGRGSVIRWEAMDKARIPLVFLFYADPVTFTSGSVYCTAAPGANELTIPASVLAHFPALTPAYGGAQVLLSVVSWPAHPAMFQAAGVDHGLAIGAFAHNVRLTVH